MSGMGPDINWGFSASMKTDELEKRVNRLERNQALLLMALRWLGRHDSTVPDLQEQLLELWQEAMKP